MPKTLIVHIGMHKTGSSSLQNFLHKNRDYFLNHHKIDYCEAYPNHGKLAAFFANNYRHFSRIGAFDDAHICLLYTSPSPRDATLSRMPSSA